MPDFVNPNSALFKRIFLSLLSLLFFMNRIQEAEFCGRILIFNKLMNKLENTMRLVKVTMMKKVKHSRNFQTNFHSDKNFLKLKNCLRRIRFLESSLPLPPVCCFWINFLDPVSSIESRGLPNLTQVSNLVTNHLASGSSVIPRPFYNSTSTSSETSMDMLMWITCSLLLKLSRVGHPLSPSPLKTTSKFPQHSEEEPDLGLMN